MADDRPGEDATSEEIAEWMENDFWESVTEGIEAVNEEDADVTEDQDSTDS